MGPQSLQNFEKTLFFFVKMSLTAPDPPDPPDPPETQHPVQNRPWVPRAGGQDYGSLHTNSLKLNF